MGMSLAFHIIFAVIGMAMPLLMAVSEGCYLWTKKPIFLELSKRWAAGTTILFAVGAVSDTVQLLRKTNQIFSTTSASARSGLRQR